MICSADTTFLDDQDWDSVELLQRIYDSICVDSGLSVDSKPRKTTVESCVAALRAAALEEDWPAAFTATVDFLVIARSSPSARRARLVMGPTKLSSTFTFDDFAIFCASLFAHWPRVEVPDCCLLETDLPCQEDTLSCEGSSVRTICRALQSLRVCFGGDLSLQERHVVKNLSFVTCGTALAHSAAIEGLFPIFFHSSSTSNADLTTSLAGFLQGLAEIFILTLARHQQWFYLLVILSNCSETGKALFGSIISQIPSRPITCRISGLRVPSIAVISLLYSLCVEDECNLSPCCDKQKFVTSEDLKQDLILTLITLLLCRNYSDEILINKDWHHHLLSQMTNKEPLTPQYVLQQLKVFLTKTCCTSPPEQKLIACSLDAILTAHVFKDDPILGDDYQRWREDDTGPLKLPMKLTAKKKSESLKMLWGRLKEGETTMKKYYAILELCSRVCESFMLSNQIRYPSEFCEDRQNGMSCSVATETLNSLTGCRLTTAEIWLMKIIETYEAENGLPSDLPGLSGPRRVFTQALNLTSHTVQCLVEPVVKCTLPPSSQVCTPSSQVCTSSSSQVCSKQVCALLPSHIIELLPGCFFKKVNDLTSTNKDHRWYLGWRALGLEILAIARCSGQKQKQIAPHLSTERLVKSFVHLYTQSANPRAVHLLHRLKSGISLCDPVSCVSDMFFDQQTVCRAFDDDESDEDDKSSKSISLKSLLISSLESKFVLMADAATQMCNKSCNRLSFFDESERGQITELILEIYLATGHAQDAAEYLEDQSEKVDLEIWRSRIKQALQTPQKESTPAVFTEEPFVVPASDGVISTISSSTSLSESRKWKGNIGDDPSQLFYQLRDSPEGLPDVSAANRIIHACVSSGELAKAEELFHILRADAHSRASAVRPDVVTGNIILKALAKWKPPRIDDMEVIFREMETDFDLGGDGVVADQVTFNTFINAAVTAGSFSKAWEYFGIMKRRKIPIDGYTCSILMKQIGPSTRPELISEILLLLAELDPCEDPVLLSSMVDVYSRLRDYGRLRAALTRYERRVSKPIPYALGTLVKGWGRCGDVAKAASLWDKLEATPGLQLTQYLCSCGVDAFVTNGDLERGLAIYRQAQAANIIVSDVQSSHLIRVCTQRRRLDDALAIYRDMQNNQLQPCDVTYNNLMHLCVLADDLETAVEILNDMSSNAKHQPDVVTYSTIIKGLCDRGAMKLAMQLFEEIPSRGVNPDIVAYNTLLEGFARADQLPQVESLFTRLLNNGIKPTCYTLTILIRFYGRRRCLDQVFHFIETLPKLYDISVDAYVYTATIAACTWNGRVDRAFEFLTSMRQHFDASGRTYGTLVAGCVKTQNWGVLSQVLQAAMEDSIVLGKRDISSLTDLCQQGMTNTRWLRGGFNANAVEELKSFLTWHANRG